MNSFDSVGDRLQRVEDILALHALKAEYAAAADAKYTANYERAPGFAVAVERQVACFTEDAVWHGGPFGGTIKGRVELLAFFRNSPWRFTAHLYSAPQITIEGDAASSIWRLWEVGLRAIDETVVLMVGTTEEGYRRTTDGWKIASMHFKMLHTLTLRIISPAWLLACMIGWFNVWKFLPSYSREEDIG